MEFEFKKDQHYAASKNGVLYHINEAHDKHIEDLYCPYCNRKMIMKCGTVRKWHFSHKPVLNEYYPRCTDETYLHACVKLKIKEWFESNTVINLEISQNIQCRFYKVCKWCETDSVNCNFTGCKRYNIKDRLTACKVEKNQIINDDVFRPDLIFYNPENPKENIFIEIKVSHECTQKKKDSSARIIEFEIKSEEDIENIIKGNCLREGPGITFYGFPCEIVINSDDSVAEYDLNQFIVYQSGKICSHAHTNCIKFNENAVKYKSILAVITAKAYDEYDIRNNHPKSIAGKDLIPLSTYCRWYISLVQTKFENIKSCNICSFNKYDTDEKHYYCEMGKDFREYYNCSCFALDEAKQIESLNEFQNYMEYNVFDVWMKDK